MKQYDHISSIGYVNFLDIYITLYYFAYSFELVLIILQVE